jgi:hypothetical protein
MCMKFWLGNIKRPSQSEDCSNSVPRLVGWQHWHCKGRTVASSGSLGSNINQIHHCALRRFVLLICVEFLNNSWVISMTIIRYPSTVTSIPVPYKDQRNELCRAVLFEKLTAAQSINSPSFIVSAGSLPCSQEPANGSDPEPLTAVHIITYYVFIHFNIIPPFTFVSPTR